MQCTYFFNAQLHSFAWKGWRESCKKQTHCIEYIYIYGVKWIFGLKRTKSNLRKLIKQNHEQTWVLCILDICSFTWKIAVHMKICNLREYLQFYMNIGSFAVFPSLVWAVLHEYLPAVPQASSYRVQPPPNEKSPPVFWPWKGRFSQFLPVQRNTLFSYFRAILHSEYLLYGPGPQLPCKAPSVGFSYNC